MTFGISGGGRLAEKLSCDLTGARKAQKSALGDAVLEGHLVEVKGATKNTLNQVRAVKYIPLVVYHNLRNSWYVVPPHVVVARVSRKGRGQHTENSFESATLYLSSLVEHEVPDPELNLREATLKAVAEGETYPELRKAMAEVLIGSRRLAEESRENVRRVLEQYGFT